MRDFLILYYFEHAARNGQTFSWANPPGDESPGEDYNCRCWAEPINPPYHPWIEWVNKRREERVTQSSTHETVPVKPADLKSTELIDRLNKASSITTEPARDAIKPVNLTWTAGAILVVLQLGGTVPIATILNVIKAGKTVQSVRRKTFDKHIFKRPDGVPKEWPTKPLKKGEGMLYENPRDKTGGTYVRVEKANPDSSNPGQRYDNIRWQKDGRSMDIDGNFVDQKSLESHIPIEKFRFNLEKIK